MSTESRPSSSHAGSKPGGGWTPPTVEELQALLPQYEIVSMLGHGGMGAVYKGRQKSLDRVVAIKILPPGLDNDDAKFVERFQNEARTMAKLNHPGIVSVYDFGETAEGQLYFIMEYVDGTDVAKMIKSSGKLPQDYALAITAHVCDALAYAHGFGVVHRDIKPANILINMQGQIKVADFGLAKMDDPAQTSGLTKTGYAMGTPDYVSPEALIMGSSIDGRADLYAIGVMLYQMLTGEIPRGMFQMPNVRSKGETDPRFDAIISKAMQTDRESRYQSAMELRRALDVILTTPHVKKDASQAVAAVPQQAVAETPGKRSAVVAKPGAKGPRPPQERSTDVPVHTPSPPKSTGLWLGIAGAAVVVICGAMFLFSGGKPKPETAAAPPAPPPAKASEMSKPSPPAKPLASKSAPAATGRVVDLLALVEVEKDSLGSKWERKPDFVTIESKQPGQFLRLPYIPPAEYDVTVRFSSSEAGGPQLHVILPTGDSGIMWMAGRDVPNRGTWSSFERLDGKYAWDQKSGPQPGAPIAPLAENVTHTTTVEFRKDGVRGVVDGKEIVHWHGNMRRFELDRTMTVLNGLKELAIGRVSRDIKIHGIEVREVSGPGTFTRGAVAASVTKIAVQFSPSTEPWVDALADPAALKLTGPVMRTADGLEFVEGGTKRVNFMRLTGPDYAVRVIEQAKDKAQPTYLYLRHTAKGYYVIFDGFHSASIGQYEGGKFTTLKKFTVERTVGAGELYELEARIVGSKITAKFDGVTLGSVEDDTLRDGGASIDTGGLFRAVQYLNLSVPAATPAVIAMPAVKETVAPAAPIDPKLAALLLHYTKYIETGLAAAAAADKPAFEAELARLKASAPLPPEDDAKLPAELKRLRGILRAQMGPQLASPVAMVTSAAKSQSLFNGSTLDGWLVGGDPASFKVEDGCIKAAGPKGNLIYAGSGAGPAWTDFDLTMNVKTGSKANSGVWIHCPVQATGASAVALEVQIANDPSAQMTGSIFGVTPITKQVVPNGQWFDLRIVVRGMMITVFIDGEKINEWTQPADWTPPTKVPQARLGSGSIGFQGYGGEIWIKDVKITVP